MGKKEKRNKPKCIERIKSIKRTSLTPASGWPGGYCRALTIRVLRVRIPRATLFFDLSKTGRRNVEWAGPSWTAAGSRLQIAM